MDIFQGIAIVYIVQWPRAVEEEIVTCNKQVGAYTVCALGKLTSLSKALKLNVGNRPFKGKIKEQNERVRKQANYINNQATLLV